MKITEPQGPNLRDAFLREIIREDCWRKHFCIPYITPDLDVPIKKQYRISICTNCMDYSDYIKQSFLNNVEANWAYPNVEFLLLNYNSHDDLDEWARLFLPPYIKKGIVNYYYTKDPIHYSMTHSRNLEFRLAQGEIVNNVDADHYIGEGFVNCINILANNCNKKVIFVKSKQKNRGRLGFFKEEFLELGGYDESIIGYGFDDSDLTFRAAALGYKAIKFGGKYFTSVVENARHQVLSNYIDEDWKGTQRFNTLQSLFNIASGKYIANVGKRWGCAKVIKNFTEEIILE